MSGEWWRLTHQLVPNDEWTNLLEERNALAAGLAEMQQAMDELHVKHGRSMRRLAEAERDAALGRIALRFVDRAGDTCDEDPAETICVEFYLAMAEEVERQRATRGLPAASLPPAVHKDKQTGSHDCITYG